MANITNIEIYYLIKLVTIIFNRTNVLTNNTMGQNYNPLTKTEFSI